MEPNDRQIAESIEVTYQILNKWIRAVHRSYFNRSDSVDITPNQYRVLKALKDRGSFRMSEFGKCIHTSCGSLTVMVDRLVEKGLIERFFLPEDRRVVMVKITEEGIKVLEEFREALLGIIMERISWLTVEEKQKISRVLKEMQDVLKTIFADEE